MLSLIFLSHILTFFTNDHVQEIPSHLFHTGVLNLMERVKYQ
jgi:hypothetical protein